jgi:prevent-host-death family protein
MKKTNAWKLQDAKARFSELVRKARAGAPQHVTVHGKEAVVVVDPTRFDVQPKPKRDRTMADFIEASKKFRGVTEGIDFEHPFPMQITPDDSIFDDEQK